MFELDKDTLRRRPFNGVVISDPDTGRALHTVELRREYRSRMIQKMRLFASRIHPNQGLIAHREDLDLDPHPTEDEFAASLRAWAVRSENPSQLPVGSPPRRWRSPSATGRKIQATTAVVISTDSWGSSSWAKRFDGPRCLDKAERSFRRRVESSAGVPGYRLFLARSADDSSLAIVEEIGRRDHYHGKQPTSVPVAELRRRKIAELIRDAEDYSAGELW